MEKLHITITNNETNEVLVDKNTDAIIGAIDTEDGTNIIGFTRCNALSLMSTAAGAMKAARNSIEDLPLFLRTLVEQRGTFLHDEPEASK